jgi:predicted SprT family Zn-dependent metalloprotease
MKNDLAEYLPLGAIDYVFPFLDKNNVHLKITRKRSTKQGDYRPPVGYPTHRISINGSLNPYSFLITLVHEMAHLEVWKKQKSIREPHGRLWKTTFITMMTPILENDIFPSDLKQILLHHLKNPKAASAADHDLTIALQRYDRKKAILLQDIPEDSLFALNGRIFKKLHKIRIHYHCQCLNNKRMYRVNGLAEVVPVRDIGNGKFMAVPS